MRALLLSVLLAACASASAADPAQPYVKKLDVPTPDTLPAKEVEVSMPRPQLVPRPAPAAPVSASGMPMVPASDPTNQAATAATPAATAPVPGKPAVAYATLAQAAKAGVDPLGEHKVASATTAPAPVAASAAFDITRPSSWLGWVQAHRDLATKYALVAAVVLAAAFVVSRFLARRNSQG